MKVKLEIITWCYLLLMLINHNKDSYYVSAKSLDPTQQNCNEHVGEFFKSFLNISIKSSEKIGKPIKHPQQRGIENNFLNHLQKFIKILLVSSKRSN